MRASAQRVRQSHSVKMTIRAILVVLLSAGGLAACGNTTTSPAATLTATTTPAGTESSVEPSSAPNPSSTPEAASPTPVPSNAAAAFEACALLTPDQLSKILGADGIQTRPMPSSGWSAGQCAWNGPASGFFISVGTAASIAAAGDPTAPDAKAKLAQFQQQASDPKDVPGIGDGAVLSAAGIAAYKGGTYLQVTNLGITEEQLIEVARLAIAQL